MPDLQDFIKVWFSNSPHAKVWLIDGYHFVSKGFHIQRGVVFIVHDGVEYLRYNQYGGGQGSLKAADPEFFNNLGIILKEMIL